jgi:hypothetical protein
MIDQVLRYALDYGHLVVIALAVLAYIRHWRGIMHIRDNPPWKTGEDLRGNQRGPLTKEEEAEFARIMASGEEPADESRRAGGSR